VTQPCFGRLRPILNTGSVVGNQGRKTIAKDLVVVFVFLP
jgi:hypothetical protein